MNNSTTIVDIKEVKKFPSEENKSVFDRLVKTVGNISIKVVPKKWNKKKVKCTSL